MATTRRDIELLISAKETTGRSFGQVTANIEALNAKIGEQVASAERGELSLQELRRAQEQLAQAGRDLSAIQGQIDAYNRLVATSDKVGAAADKAKADLAALKAEIESGGTATKAQENRLQRLENAVIKTGAAVDKNAQDLAEQTAALERAGVAVDGLDRAQAGVVNSARQVGAGLVQVNAAVDAYSTNLAVAREREAAGRRASADATRLETAEKRLALNQQTLAQQEATTRQTALIESLREAEQRLAQQSAFDAKIAEAQRLGDASRFVQLFADSIQTVSAAENQLSSLTGFRAVGQQAAEASRDISQFVQSGQTFAVTSQQVAAGLRAIIDPAGSANQTLRGVEEAIETASATASNGSKNVGQLSAAYNDLAAAAAAILRQGSLVDTFLQQEAATAAARQQFEAAQNEVQRLGQAMAQADTPTAQLAGSLKTAESQLQQAGRALAQEEVRLGELSRGLKAAGINTTELAAEQARLEAAATSAASSISQINTTLGRGGQQTNGFLGLRPNDLANLSFQINDIFVSLASGQNPLIVLIQQGSQIGQLFPGLISTLARFGAVFLPVIAVVTALGFAIAELVSDADRLKQAGDDLAAAPLGDGIDVQKFADAQEKLEGVASSAEEARSAMLLLVEEGFNTDQIERYSEAAGQLAERLGIDVVEATQLLVDVQQGGIEAVFDLTEKTNDLTDADLDHAQALFDAGKAGEARQFVLDRVAERNQEIADATNSSWTPAVKNLQVAFQNFSNFLERVFRPAIDNFNKDLNNLIVGFTFLTGLLAGKGVQGSLADARAAFDSRKAGGGRGGGASDQSIRDRRFAAELDDEVDQTRELSKAERLARVEREARARAQKAGVTSALEERAVTQAIAAEQKKINEEAAKGAKSGAAAGNKAAAAAARAARQAAAEERKRESALRALDSQLRQLNRAAFAGQSASLEERLTAINERYETIAESIQKVRDLGLTTDSDGVDLAVIERQVEATKQRLRDEETISFFQDRAATLGEQRDAEILRVTDAQERGAIGTGEAMEQTAEIVGRISPQVIKAAQDALVVARALAGTTPSPEMVAWIAQLERVISAEQTDRSVADVGLAGFEETNNRLDQLLSERDQLVQSYQTLFDLGLLGAAEVRDLTASAYASQAASILPVLDQLREQAALLNATIDPLTQLPILTDAAYAVLLNRIDAVNAGLSQIDPRLQQVNAAASQAIQNGVAQSFNAVAQSIVGLIGGTQSFGDALSSLGQTALSVFGSILQAIAQVLIQMIALQIAQSLLGIPPGGGGGAGGGLLSFLFHDGGVVGSRGVSRQRRTGGDSSWIGAPKFHGGGGLGLRPDEYKAVLQRGEEVLTEDDPRHIRNVGSGGGSEGGGGGIKQVLLLDPDAVPNAMQSRAGERAMLSVIRTNKETIKQVLS